MIFLVKAKTNKGTYSIKLGNSPGAGYVQVTGTPQGFPDDVGQHILNTHSKYVMQVDAPADARLVCPDCGNDYATASTLKTHKTKVHS